MQIQSLNLIYLLLLGAVLIFKFTLVVASLVLIIFIILVFMQILPNLPTMIYQNPTSIRIHRLAILLLLHGLFGLRREGGGIVLGGGYLLHRPLVLAGWQELPGSRQGAGTRRGFGILHLYVSTKLDALVVHDNRVLVSASIVGPLLGLHPVIFISLEGILTPQDPELFIFQRV